MLLVHYIRYLFVLSITICFEAFRGVQLDGGGADHLDATLPVLRTQWSYTTVHLSKNMQVTSAQRGQFSGQSHIWVKLLNWWTSHSMSKNNGELAKHLHITFPINFFSVQFVLTKTQWHSPQLGLFHYWKAFSEEACGAFYPSWKQRKLKYHSCLIHFKDSL